MNRELNRLDRLEIFSRAAALYERGIKQTKESLEAEEKATNLYVQMHDSLERETDRKSLDMAIEAEVEFSRIQAKDMFVKGFMAAHGVQDIFHSQGVREEQRKIVYLDEMLEKLVLVTKDLLIIGARQDDNLEKQKEPTAATVSSSDRKL